jgi:ring-1,2-phenylacetyl-CoA epoxidase subunit PaaD
MSVSLAEVWRILDEVKDPEIPVVSVVEMGLIRTLGMEGGALVVVMTPTFAGCPALQVIQSDIAQRLGQAGYENVSVRISLSPAWTTDWITPRAREKLRGFGLAPPPYHSGELESALAQAAICPYCGSTATSLKNGFGPTLCRAIYFCNACRQPFEQFKPI